MPEPERPQRIDETDAKAGSNEGVVRWVLGISLGATIIALTIIWVTGALTQGPVESQMNVERKAEARQDAAEDNEGLAEQGDMISPGTDQQAQSPAPDVSN